MSQKRQFPKFYEKAVPVILVFIGIAVVALLLFIAGVACGFFSPAI